jgi:hypothetical protein
MMTKNFDSKNNLALEEFYLVLKENKKKFVDSEFVKTCHEHVIYPHILAMF